MREGWHGLSALRDQYGRGGRGAAAATLAAARARTRARAAALAPPVGIGLIASSSEGSEQSAPAAVLSDSGDPVEASGVTNDVRADGREGGESGESQVSVLTAERSDTVVGVRQQSNLRAGSGGVIHTTTVRGLSSSPPFMTKWASAFLRCLGRVLAWARRKRPEFSGVFDWLLRLHLAVFYFDGRYPSVAMRTAEARLMYTRQQDEPRARYAILGLLSLVQALGEAAVAAGARLSRNSDTARVAGGGVSGEGSGGSGGAGDVDLVRVRFLIYLLISPIPLASVFALLSTLGTSILRFPDWIHTGSVTIVCEINQHNLRQNHSSTRAWYCRVSALVRSV